MSKDQIELKMMPLIMGSQVLTNPLYTNMESVMLQYETEKEAIVPLLPEGFAPAKEAFVTIAYSQSQGVDFMAGNGYRIFSIAVLVKYDGEEDHLVGNYILTMFEDATMPIITGRELQGVPKIYAEISPVRTLGDNLLRCEASLWGHFLMGINIELPMKRQNLIVCKAAAKLSSGQPVFAYKYIPSLDGPPDADYPTVLWFDYTIDQLWLGKSGNITIGEPEEQNVGIYNSILNVLKTLPVKTVTRTSRSFGSMVIRNDKCGRLR